LLFLSAGHIGLGGRFVVRVLFVVPKHLAEGWMTEYSWFDLWQEQRIFLLSKVTRLDLGFSQFHMQSLSSGPKRPDREVNPSVRLMPKLMCRAVSPFPHTPLWCEHGQLTIYPGP